MNRRAFLEKSTMAGLGFAFLPSIPEFLKGKKVGVQLWSVRDVMMDAPEKTLEKIAGMGYKYIEHANYKDGKFYGKTPSAFKQLLKSFGLSMPSGHSSLVLDSNISDSKAMMEFAKKTAEDAAEAGAKYLVQPWLEDKLRNAKSLATVTEAFNNIGILCKSNGLTFGYHNHDFEFQKVGDTTIYQYMLDNTAKDLVAFEMDLYWVKFAGQEPVDWIKKYPGRFPLYHVKDMAKTKDRVTIEVGEGSIDFKSIFEHSRTAGLKYYIVELEHYQTNSMDGVALAYRNLQTILKG